MWHGITMNGRIQSYGMLAKGTRCSSILEGGYEEVGIANPIGYRLPVGGVIFYDGSPVVDIGGIRPEMSFEVEVIESSKTRHGFLDDSILSDGSQIPRLGVVAHQKRAGRPTRARGIVQARLYWNGLP